MSHITHFKSDLFCIVWWNLLTKRIKNTCDFTIYDIIYFPLRGK